MAQVNTSQPESINKGTKRSLDDYKEENEQIQKTDEPVAVN